MGRISRMRKVFIVIQESCTNGSIKEDSVIGWVKRSEDVVSLDLSRYCGPTVTG